MRNVEVFADRDALVRAEAENGAVQPSPWQGAWPTLPQPPFIVTQPLSMQVPWLAAHIVPAAMQRPLPPWVKSQQPPFPHTP